MDNNASERILRGPANSRKVSFGSHSATGARLSAVLFSLFATLALAGINPHHWLLDYLNACAENAGRAPSHLDPWLPWAMTTPAWRGCAAPTRPAARTVTDSPRYCGRAFCDAELALIRALIAEHDPPLNRAALSRVVCERLDWRKPDGGLKDMSARVCCACTARASSRCLPRASAPDRESPSRFEPTRRHWSPRRRSTRCARCVSNPSPPAPRGGCGTPSSPATTTSATTPCPAPRCATSSTPPPASPWPCSASVPRPGRPPRATASSAGAPHSGQRNPRTRGQQRPLPHPALDPHPQPRLAPPRPAPAPPPARLATPLCVRPVLLETFCETPRFLATCYQSNWLCVGQTQGRGKLDVHHQSALPVKSVWLKPLRKIGERSSAARQPPIRFVLDTESSR